MVVTREVSNAREVRFIDAGNLHLDLARQPRKHAYNWQLLKSGLSIFVLG